MGGVEFIFVRQCRPIDQYKAVEAPEWGASSMAIVKMFEK